MFSTPPRQPILPIHDPDSCWLTIKDTQPFLSVPSIKATDNPYTGTPKKSAKSLRVVCISDTHGKHRFIPIPKCDVLIHGGDFTQTGELSQIKDLSDYFLEVQQQQIVKHKVVCIAGNHDMTLHPDYYKTAWKTFHPRNGPLDCDVARNLLQNCVYLEDELYTLKTSTCNDAAGNDSTSTPSDTFSSPSNEENTTNSEIINNIYGSPWSPTFYNWAFNEDRHLIQKKWDLIPKDTDIDVLITHGPPLGRGDLCKSNNRAGCLDLLRTVQNDIKPRVHIFGHIHEDYGYSYDGQTLFINASSVNFGYQPGPPCIVFDLPHDKTLPAQIVTPCSNLDGEGVLTWLKQKVHEQQERAQTKQARKNTMSRPDSFEELIPFFERKSPLMTGEELLSYTNDRNMLGSVLQMHREPHWHSLVGKLGQVMLQFHADSL